MPYDLAIIGAGWAGINAAIRAKELGLKTILLEKKDLGGTCLNSGCIPTKALIQSAKIFDYVNRAGEFGIQTITAQPDIAAMQSRIDKLIRQLRKGLEQMLKGIDFMPGEAKFLGSDTLQLKDKQIKAKNFIIASGSKPKELNELKFDAKKILSSEDILKIHNIPKNILIVGAGAIGCEFAGLFSILKSEVTLVEIMAQLLPGLDMEVSRKLETLFKKKSIKVITQAQIQSLDTSGYELILICAGRSVVTQGLGLEKIGIQLQADNIHIDQFSKTNLANIYAAGDCTAKLMLAHFASFQGRLAVENIVQPNSQKLIANSNIPCAIFTDPEIASVGITEDEARKEDLKIEVRRLDFLSSGMARILGKTDGFMKLVIDSGSLKILGVSIIGPQASEIIGFFTLAINNGLSIAQLKRAILPHPSISESIADILK